MTQWHMETGRKVSGGKVMTDRRSDKRLAWKGGEPALTTIAATEEDIQYQYVKGLGGTKKVKLKLGIHALVPEGTKTRKLKILTVAENPANSQFARQNIITKGAVLKASDGSKEHFVKVTSRPGHDGDISGVVLKDYVPKKEQVARSKKEKTKKGVKASKNGESDEKK